MASNRSILSSWRENKKYTPKLNYRDSGMETDGIRGETTSDMVIQGGKISPAVAYRFGIAGALIALASRKCSIHIARDNRGSSPDLMSAAIAGALGLGVDVKIDGKNGITSTPQCGSYGRNDPEAGAAIVIAGSHNPEHQNGLKLFDHQGKKISPKWERITDRVVNAKNLKSEIGKLVREEKIDLTGRVKGKKIVQPNINKEYVKGTVENVRKILVYKKTKTRKPKLLILDASNGSGSSLAREVAKSLKDLNIAVINSGNGIINKDCGANILFRKNLLPKGIKLTKKPSSKKYAVQVGRRKPVPVDNVVLWSIDGDNDRNIGCYLKNDGTFDVIDGNKIAAYIVRCIKNNIDNLGLKMKIGYVMTVVANKAAQQYVQTKLKLSVLRTKVGDKYTRAGAEKFDIGVYYEDTGHGAIHFSPRSKKAIINSNPKTKSQSQAREILLAMMNLQNEACGDGVRNSLMVEALMAKEGWNIEKLANIYHEYPKCLVYISIENKKALTTKDNLGLEVLKPVEVKTRIKAIMKGLGNSYEHVTRASGTEPFIKVQVQGPDRSKAEQTAYEIAQVVYDNSEIKGKGETPVDAWRAKKFTKFNQYLFKHYDIRGLADTDLTNKNVYLLGRAYATLIRRIEKTKKRVTVAVGRDVRLSSPRISKHFIKGMLDSGVNVIDIGLVPIEVSYFAVPYFDVPGSVMITASHNPKEWNGFKPLIGLLNMSPDQIQELRRIAEEEDFLGGKGKFKKRNITDEYIEMIKADIRLGARKWHWMTTKLGLCKAIQEAKKLNLQTLPFKGLKIITDTGNGAVGNIAKRAYQGLGAKVTTINVKRDGNFPNHIPDTFGWEAQKDIIPAMKKTRYDAGFLFDGDGDRLQTFTSTVRNPEGDLILCLLIEPVLEEFPGSKVIYEINCSKAVADHTRALGGIPVEWYVGHTIIRMKLFEEKAPIGGEISGHIYYYDNYLFDDAIFAGAKLLDKLAKSDEDLDQMLDRLPQYIISPQLRYPAPEEGRGEIVEAVKRNFKKRGFTIDEKEGAKIIFKKLNGWFLVRGSNTNPEVTFKAEAKQKVGYNIIILEAYNELKKYPAVDITKLRNYIKEAKIK
jgi:phosphomannomutase/phosphoglucomutase